MIQTTHDLTKTISQKNIRNYALTILTPSFNRAYTLDRLLQSLMSQTCKSFEWILVDDGSTDSTVEFFQNLPEEIEFKATYLHQNNSGKHAAINRGVEHATSDWILILDSDDFLTPDAVSTIICDLQEHEKIVTTGLCYRRSHLNNAIIGNLNFPESFIIAHPTDAAPLFNGDLAYIFKSSLMRQIKFPTFKNEKFVPEGYVWNKIGDIGKILYFTKKSIYICEYLSDGYTANFKRNLKANPNGFGIYYIDQFYREKSLTKRIKNLVRYLQCLYYKRCRN